MLDYLDWESSLSLEQVFASAEAFSHPTYTSLSDCLYLGAVKEEKNRSALMLRDQAGGKYCLTPSPYGLQTKVNEYGGKPYWLFDDLIVFANQADQCLYRQQLSKNSASPPSRISIKPTESRRYMYTDVQHLGAGYYLAIVEVEDSSDSSENKMFIGLISGDSDAEPIALSHGADFYSNLVFCTKTRRVAWVQWQHPAMPWDATELWIASISNSDSQYKLKSTQRISVAPDKASEPSICQLLFAANGRLFFSADYKSSTGINNYWRLHAYDFDSESVARITPDVTQDGIEFGYPHWVYGDARIVQLDRQWLLAVGSLPEGDQLFIIDQDSFQTIALQTTAFGESAATLQHLASNHAGRCLLTKLAKDAPPGLVEVTFKQQPYTVLEQRSVIGSKVLGFDKSHAEHIAFATRDGQQAYGFYYAPCNKKFQSKTKADAKPPLIVMVHGGPTARAYGHFDLQKQFWTSRGFAILDVNHRGSSGYGRCFRDALYGQWGELDASDIIDGINYLVGLGKADSGRICIRGKSAGGYSVLRALTEFPTVFKAGACYYGIGNLVTLAETTHKFEKHYTDRLVDEVFNASVANLPASRFYQRSPINKIGNVGSAMIVFQGALDKVVPPTVAQEVVAALKAANLDYEYVEYADEAHGFRQTDNNIDALQKELAFYRRVLAY